MEHKTGKKINDIQTKLDEFMRKSSNNDIGISKDIEYIKKEVGEIKALVGDHYVTKAEFEPIKKIVFGLVGLILTAVVVAVVSLVIK